MKILSEEERSTVVKAKLAWNDPLGFGFVFAVIGAFVAVLLLAILRLNHGVFIYMMDDPYIHLSLSDQIRHGNYGIFPGVHSAPSSSILFPFLLALASGAFIHPYLPLIINLLSLFATLEIIRRFLRHLDLVSDRTGAAILAAGVLATVLCLDLIGVAFTGLEHNLSIALVVAVLYGVVLFVDTRKLPVWLPAVIVLSPLLRYEGFPLSIAALLVLAFGGCWRTAVAAFAVMMALMLGFAVFLLNLGLLPLPGSVLAKSMVLANWVGAGHGLMGSLVGLTVRLYQKDTGLLILLVGALLVIAFCMLALLVRNKTWTPRTLVSLVLLSLVLSLIAGHSLARRFGWFNRYQIYAFLGIFLVCAYLAQGSLRKALSQRGLPSLAPALITAACVAFIGVHYFGTTLLVPLASNNIYEQQYQMHRFVVDYYRGPVAVNDLGLVSYHNPNYVLDLGGLASKQARLLMADGDSAQYASLVGSHDVHVVIIYESWFQGKIPASWLKVATMDLSRRRVSAAGSEVAFFATDPSTAVKVRGELADFQKTLPPGVKLAMY